MKSVPDGGLGGFTPRPDAGCWSRLVPGAGQTLKLVVQEKPLNEGFHYTSYYQLNSERAT